VIGPANSFELFPARKGKKHMTENAVPAKLVETLAVARRERMWGQIILEMRDGKIELLRKNATEKIEMREKPCDENSYR
jgi:hypothetical protein